MENNYGLSPQDGKSSSEYEEYMAQTYGPDWKTGFRVGFGKRLGALLLDILFVMLLSGILYIILPFDSMQFNWSELFGGDLSSLENMEQEALALAEDNFWPSYISDLVVLMYFFMEAALGYTFGKRILGIKIADVNLKPTFSKRLIRFLAKYSYMILPMIFFAGEMSPISFVSGFLSFIVLIGCFFALGRNKQALHDMIAGTAVFNEESLEWSGQNG